MGTQLKLHEREKRVLKLEEESLRSLIFQYQSALNALKVEELTLTNKLGQSLDRVRQSQVNTPTAPQHSVCASGNLPTLVSKINTSEDVFKPAPLPANETQINQKILNLNVTPLINSNGVLANERYEENEDELEVWTT